MQGVGHHTSLRQKQRLSWHIFFPRFLKHCRAELKNSAEVLRFVIMYIGGLFLFLIEFEAVQGVLGVILPPVIIGLSVMYLTLLPSYLIVPFVLLPKKFTLPALGLSVLFSFFIVFLI